MAERRMFAKTIIDSDAFLDMPISTQVFYFHLSMRADDDGFINNPKKVQRMVNCSDDDLKLLIAKQFIIPFRSGVCVIRHWKIHNYLRNDRYKETVYLEEKRKLIEEENRAYLLADSADEIASIPDVNQTVYQWDTQVRIGKVRIDKDRIGEYRGNICTAEAVQHILDYLNMRLGTRYKATSKINRTHIQARIGEGYSIEDFERVIDKKACEWMGTDFQKFLRPQTLFGTKFEAYLNQPVEKSRSKKAKDNILAWVEGREDE